jgi:hypothetical protein
MFVDIDKYITNHEMPSSGKEPPISQIFKSIRLGEDRTKRALTILI